MFISLESAQRDLPFDGSKSKNLPNPGVPKSYSHVKLKKYIYIFFGGDASVFMYYNA